jgi:hypothetical protein
MASLFNFYALQNDCAITTTVSEIQRIKEEAQKHIIQFWIGCMFTRIRDRMVQQVHQTVNKYPLGVVPLAVIRSWLGESTKRTTRSRPAREANGRRKQDKVEIYSFIGDELCNLPCAPLDWFYFEHQEIGGANRQLYMRISNLHFYYNVDTQFLETKFSYIVLQPMFEHLGTKEIVVGGDDEFDEIEEVDEYGWVWRPA